MHDINELPQERVKNKQNLQLFFGKDTFIVTMTWAALNTTIFLRTGEVKLKLNHVTDN